MTDVAEALTAYKQASGLSDPVPDYLEPEYRAAALRDIQTWYERREGDGPWCWQCGKPAVFQRRALPGGPSLWCALCSKVPGVFYPLGAEVPDA